mmetsp:Transcript_13770/g.27399  ORF Transcript_13770/g.27399 Transcript_13770/m.27399 type:complete len:85 (+) Transcript_13770:1243-1497(+)
MPFFLFAVFFINSNTLEKMSQSGGRITKTGNKSVGGRGPAQHSTAQHSQTKRMTTVCVGKEKGKNGHLAMTDSQPCFEVAPQPH